MRRRGTVRLPMHLAGVLSNEGWRTWPLETGGIILGKRIDACADITAVIGPGPDATHERYTFTPNSDWQATQVAEAWERDPTTEYLGDWHTHPGGTTRFSPLDLQTAKTIAAYRAARQPQPLMLVLALNRNVTARAAAAQLHQGRLQPVTLEATGG